MGMELKATSSGLKLELHYTHTDGKCYCIAMDVQPEDSIGRVLAWAAALFNRGIEHVNELNK